jgi:hypothetical protein
MKQLTRMNNAELAQQVERLKRDVQAMCASLRS